MSFYGELSIDADEIIKEFGGTTTLTKPGTPTYDPSTGETTATPTVLPCAAVVFPYEDRFIDGTLILQGDQQAYLSAIGLTVPVPGDVLAWGGVNYTVIRTKNLGPNGVTFVLYELQVRKA